MEEKKINKFLNIQKMVSTCEPVYNKMQEYGLINITGKFIERDIIETKDGHRVLNMSSCCYLGINDHPEVKKGLHKGIDDAGGVMQLVNAGFRIRLSLQDEVSEEFSNFYKAPCWVTTNCGMAALGTLPMLAAGIFTEGIRPTMVFDKNAHFCMNYMKANCNDETEVITIQHNDFEALEKLCQEKEKIAYICESVYSTGGITNHDRIIELQEKYNMYIYIDEAHGISIMGENGKGMILGNKKLLNKNTMIIASLSKGFGANGGGLIICYDKHYIELIKRYGGPMLWTAPLGSAIWGGIREALKLHQNGSVEILQAELRKKVKLFDELMGIDVGEEISAVRLIKIEDETKLFKIAKFLYDKGYYVSTLTFPTVKRSDSGLRIMIRSNMYDSEIREFVSLLKGALCKI